MFIIQQRKSSTIRTVVLAIMLEFTFVEKILSKQNICENKNRGRISYFTLRSEDVNWTEAWRQCNNQSATLPVICNQQDQDAFTKYLRENTRYLSAWTSARKIRFDEWKWIDGQSFTSRVAEQNEHYTRAYFELALSHYTATDPRRKRPYLCYYSDILGSWCKFGNAIHMKNGCIRPSWPNDERSWFDSRNLCVRNGGDLAIIVDDDDVGTIRNSSELNTANRFWIGLGNNTWRWMRQRAEPTDDSDEDVKYTNWGYNQPYSSGECISINVSTGGWNSVSCTDKEKVVCQARIGLDETASGMSSSVTKSRPTRSSETASTKSTRMMSTKLPSKRNRPTTSSAIIVLSATTHSMSNISESPAQRMTDVESQLLLYSGLGAGVAIIIICIIVIIFVVRYKRKPDKNIDQSKVMNSSELNGSQLSPNKPATSPANASAIAPVAGTDDTLGVYAEITLEPLNQSEDEDKIQQPGVLYAALEFQKEPTYLEPSNRNAHASDQTRVGPMGDIYAIPDAKGRTGNEAVSHPLLVTSQGDVYALPLKNSKSPTAHSPVGGIYANL